MSEQAATGNIVASDLGAMPTVAVAYAVVLPKKHTLMAGDEFEVEAGKDGLKMGGVLFTCLKDCVDPIAEGEDGELMASTAARATAMQLPPPGYLAFVHPTAGVSDLSDTLRIRWTNSRKISTMAVSALRLDLCSDACMFPWAAAA